MRTAAKRDAAERPLIDALEGYGYQVTQVSSPGCPDLLVRRADWPAGLAVGGEVKSAGGRLTDRQGTWPVWRTVEDALDALGLL